MHLLQYVAWCFPGSESASRIPEFIDDAGQLSCEPPFNSYVAIFAAALKNMWAMLTDNCIRI